MKKSLILWASLGVILCAQNVLATTENQREAIAQTSVGKTHWADFERSLAYASALHSSERVGPIVTKLNEAYAAFLPTHAAKQLP